MRVVLMTIGSRGDVDPFVGLGTRLRDAGHDVVVATQEAFAEHVRGRGLEFRPLAGDLRTDLGSAGGRHWQDSGTTLRSLPSTLRFSFDLRRDLGPGVIAAAEDADVLLLQRMVNLHGFLAAKAMGIPGMTLELFPTPNWAIGDFPPAGTNFPDLGRFGNRTAHRLTRVLARSLGPLARPWFDEYLRDLGLPRVGFDTVSRAMLDETWPIHHGYSPALLPRPVQWPPATRVDGYWWLDRPAGWQPPAELLDFLQAGPPPVFLGFGSMMPGDAERLSEVVVDATRRAGVRAVVQAGWSGLNVGAGVDGGGDVLSVGDVPHDWLFPRMAAVVHHGGAGTTGAGVRAGVPAVVAPVLADQPFWAARLVAAGVSPGSVPLGELTGSRLGELIRQAVQHPEYRRRAEFLGQRVRAEDGAAAVLADIDRLGD